MRHLSAARAPSRHRRQGRVRRRRDDDQRHHEPRDRREPNGIDAYRCRAVRALAANTEGTRHGDSQRVDRAHKRGRDGHRSRVRHVKHLKREHIEHCTRDDIARSWRAIGVSRDRRNGRPRPDLSSPQCHAHLHARLPLSRRLSRPAGAERRPEGETRRVRQLGREVRPALVSL